MSNLTDDIARLTSIVARMHQGGTLDGRGAQLRRSGRLEVSQIAALCGTTPAAVYAWENGALVPSTGEALAWLDMLYSANDAARTSVRAAAAEASSHHAEALEAVTPKAYTVKSAEEASKANLKANEAALGRRVR